MAAVIDKSTKYDRQLRLWAQDGQSRLEQSHICLINANATGAEILKNLVLPGIGAYTIIDNTIVTADDLSGNFFLADEDVGTGAAAALCRNLQELNPDVEGNYLDEPLAALLAQREVWSTYTLVVVSGFISTRDFSMLSELLWDANIPLLCVSSIGFYGTLRVMAKQTTIIETHDPSKTFDLRIDCPWDELEAYSASFCMEELDDTEHAHVPYIVIYIKALEKWKYDHNGNGPVSYTEKRLFRSHYVEQMSRDISVETNFIEAAQSVHRALQKTTIPQSTRLLMHRPEAADDGELSIFWLLVRALKKFVEKNGKLPLPGNLPDMASTTANYIQLQQIYHRKALKDKENFSTELKNVCISVGKDPSEIGDDVVSTFCKNSAFLYLAEGTPLLASEALKKQLHLANSSKTDTEATDLCIYFGILALHKLAESDDGDSIESFFAAFSALTTVPAAEFSSSTRDILTEIFRHQVNNYHNICSLIGGVASQEALKITTSQYIPLDDLYIFNGVQSTSSKWKV